MCRHKWFWRGTKGSQIFELAQKIWTGTKHFGTCKRTRHNSSWLYYKSFRYHVTPLQIWDKTRQIFKRIKKYAILLHKFPPIKAFKRGLPNQIWIKFLRADMTRNGILLPKLFWPTVRKIFLVFEKNFWNSRLKAKHLQNFWNHNLFKQ